MSWSQGICHLVVRSHALRKGESQELKGICATPYNLWPHPVKADLCVILIYVYKCWDHLPFPVPISLGEALSCLFLHFLVWIRALLCFFY